MSLRQRIGMRRCLEHNLGHLYGLSFCRMFLVIIPIAVPFFQGKGLDMQEVFLLQALFGVTVVIGEVPSGYMADFWGRRPTLLLGTAFCGLGHSLLWFAEGFWTLVLFEVSLGISLSLISGADVAVLYDTQAALFRKLDRGMRGMGSLYAVWSASEALAGVACSLLLLHSLEGLVLVQITVGWLPLLFAFLLVEPPRSETLPRSHLENYRQIRALFTDSGPLLRLVFLALACWSLTTFYAVWLLQKYWEIIGVPLTWFGYLWAGYNLLSGLAGRWAGRTEALFGAPMVALLIGALPVLGYAGMSLLDGLASLGFATCFFYARGLGLVTLRDALNRRVASSCRATINSLASFLFRGVFAVTGPLLGWALDLWGMQTALVLAGGFSLLVLALVILPLAWIWHRHG